MGLEADCQARWGKKTSAGRAHLDSDKLDFRGKFKLSIPFKEIKSAEAKAGHLKVRFPGGLLDLDLGKQAEKWALKIRYPRSRIDKLGVKPDSRVAVLGVEDKDFHRELGKRAKQVAVRRLQKETDIIFLAAENTEALKRLRSLQRFLKPNGAIWVVWPKGQLHIKQAHVMATAKQAGLVDVKIVAFSDTHSALKLVIPLARR